MNYNGQEIPLKIMNVHMKHHEPGQSIQIMVSNQVGWNILYDIEKEDFRGPEAEHLDSMIYFYVENKDWELSNDEIAKNCLDEEMINVHEL